MAGLPPTIIDASVTLTFGAAGQYYGYCTIADVSFEFPDKALFSELSGSTGNSVIAQEITYAAQELQEQLALVYQMPYTGTDGGILLRLRNLNAALGTARLIERYFRGSELNASGAGANLRSEAHLVLTDILDGVIQWAAPFGDAVALAERPVYPRGKGATVLPDPNSADPNAATPIFTMGLTRFRTNTLM